MTGAGVHQDLKILFSYYLNYSFPQNKLRQQTLIHGYPKSRFLKNQHC